MQYPSLASTLSTLFGSTSAADYGGLSHQRFAAYLRPRVLQTACGIELNDATVMSCRTCQFSASHPTTSVDAPDTSKPIRTVKNSLSMAPVSHGGTSLLPLESRDLGEVPSQYPRTFRNSQVTIQPTKREKSNQIAHSFMVTISRSPRVG